MHVKAHTKRATDDWWTIIEHGVEFKASLQDVFNPLFTAIVHVPESGRRRVTVEHRHSGGNNGDDTLHLDNMSPATEPLVKG